MAGWSVRGLARLIGINHNTLQYWVATGLVTVEERRRGRSGHGIGLAGLLEAVTVAELREAEFSLQAIREAINLLRKETRRGEYGTWGDLLLVSRGDDLQWMPQDDLDPISLHKKPRQRVMVFPIGAIYQEARERADQVERTPTAVR